MHITGRMRYDCGVAMMPREISFPMTERVSAADPILLSFRSWDSQCVLIILKYDSVVKMLAERAIASEASSCEKCTVSGGRNASV